MAAPTVYRWDDAEAPIARGVRGSMCDILRACLVDGYGDKQAAGWTLEFINETEDKAVFRNNVLTGTGFFLQVDCLTSSQAYGAVVQGYETMSSVDTGLGAFTDADTHKTRTSNQNSALARPWILIADDRAFWFFCWNSITTTPINTSTIVSSFFFGDGIAIDEGDESFCMINAYDSGYMGFGRLSLPTTSTYAITGAFSSPRSRQGVIGSRMQALIRGGGPGSDTFIGASGSEWTTGQVLYLSRPYINDCGPYSVRGFIPGLYSPCHSRTSFTQLDTLMESERSFVWITGYVSAGQGMGSLFISADDWRV